MPADQCPKCGRFTRYMFDVGEWFYGPRYNAVDERLDYSCKQCGYVFSEPTREKAVAAGKDD